MLTAERGTTYSYILIVAVAVAVELDWIGGWIVEMRLNGCGARKLLVRVVGTGGDGMQR